MPRYPIPALPHALHRPVPTDAGPRPGEGSHARWLPRRAGTALMLAMLLVFDVTAVLAVLTMLGAFAILSVPSLAILP